MNLRNIFTAMLVITPKKHQRYYLNAVHIEHQGDKCVLETSDGTTSLRVFCSTYPFRDLLARPGDSLVLSRESIDEALAYPGEVVLRRGKDDSVFSGCCRLKHYEVTYPGIPYQADRAGGITFELWSLDKLSIAIRMLRQGCVSHGTQIAVEGMLSMAGHCDDIEYCGYVAPKPQ